MSDMQLRKGEVPFMSFASMALRYRGGCLCNVVRFAGLLSKLS